MLLPLILKNPYAHESMPLNITPLQTYLSDALGDVDAWSARELGGCAVQSLEEAMRVVLSLELKAIQSAVRLRTVLVAHSNKFAAMVCVYEIIENTIATT